MYPTIPVNTASRNPLVENFVKAILADEEAKARFAGLSGDSKSRFADLEDMGDMMTNNACKRIAQLLGLPEPTASNGGFEAVRDFCKRYKAEFLR